MDEHTTSKELPETKAADPDYRPHKKESGLANFFGFENLRSLGLLVLIIFAFRWSVVSPYHVPTASMEPTIKVGDRLLAWKLSYDFKIPFTDYTVFSWSQPEKGDIIVFRYPRNPDIDYVKRVVGVPGDRIRVKENILYVNGEEQKRENHDYDRTILEDIDDSAEAKTLFRENLAGVDHWVIQDRGENRHLRRNDFPLIEGEDFVVPEESFFVMGDNRDNSTDSRAWGIVPKSYVRGQAIFVLWSVFSPPDASFPQLRFNRFGHILQ